MNGRSTASTRPPDARRRPRGDGAARRPCGAARRIHDGRARRPVRRRHLPAHAALPAPRERLRTLREIRRRLQPGAPLVTFHHSVPDGNARAAWLERHTRFAAGPDASPAQVAESAATLATQLPILRPDEDEALLYEAGFEDVGTYYAALTLRGWLAYASDTTADG